MINYNVKTGDIKGSKKQTILKYVKKLLRRKNI
jgi:hypothetical protein